MKSVTQSKPQAEVWRKITRNMGGHMPSRGWAGFGLERRGGKSGGSVVSFQPLLLGCQKQFQEPKEVGRQLRGRARHARIPSILSLHEGRDAWGKERDSLATHRSDRSQNEQRKELLSQLS